jgi:hypothetical protein
MTMNDAVSVWLAVLVGGTGYSCMMGIDGKITRLHVRAMHTVRRHESVVFENIHALVTVTFYLGLVAR